MLTDSRLFSRPMGWLQRLKGTRRPVDTTAPRICVVTPVFNGAGFLDDAIASVVMQSGDFVLHYHVQDGGSTDGTGRIVRKWMNLQETGRLPFLCRKLVFTAARGPDAGMYDAVNKAFSAALPPGPDVMMGWIAADDRLAAGALQTVCEVRRDLPDVRFMGGRIALLNEQGCTVDVMRLHAFARAGMAAGLYDGRGRAFVMQEGTFWSADLWEKVGGLDPTLRLAGDWDLWRRIAAHADYASIDGLIGFHRKRPGQASGDIGRYYAEVDSVLAREGLQELYRDTISHLQQAGFHDACFGTGPQDAIAVRYDPNQTRWVRTAT